jgi:hypothetical protein
MTCCAGDICFLNIRTGELRRIVYSNPNSDATPQARLTHTPFCDFLLAEKKITSHMTILIVYVVRYIRPSAQRYRAGRWHSGTKCCPGTCCNPIPVFSLSLCVCVCVCFT